MPRKSATSSVSAGYVVNILPILVCLIGMKAHVELLHAVSALHQVIEITGRAKRPEFAYEREVTFVRRDLAVVANKVRCFIVDRLANDKVRRNHAYRLASIKAMPIGTSERTDKSGEMPDKNWARRALGTAASAPPCLSRPITAIQAWTRVSWSLLAVTSSVCSSGAPGPRKWWLNQARWRPLIETGEIKDLTPCA